MTTQKTKRQNCQNCGAEIIVHYTPAPQINTRLLRDALGALHILAIANADEKLQKLAEDAIEELENISETKDKE